MLCSTKQPMTDSDSASRQLRVIRSLMERATIYRSISAPTAFVGGLLSLGGFATAYYAKHHRQHPLSPTEFLIVWLVILALTGLTNAIFLSRGAARRSESFFSPGMRCAFTSLAPAFFSAGLLATQHFAPRSLVALGLTFFVAGSGLLVSWKHFFMPNPHVEPSALVVSGIMAATFGGFHLAYAAVVWALGEEKQESSLPATESEHV
jgi:hypothetical protein